MTKKEMEEPTSDRKKYILPLLLLFILLGIWQCPKFLKEQPISEIPEKTKDLQVTESTKKDTAIVNTTNALIEERTSATKEDMPSSKPKEKDTEVVATPEKKEVAPTLPEPEKSIAKKELTESVVIDTKPKEIQEKKEEVKNSTPLIPKNTCTISPKLKIDQNSFQRCLAFAPDGSKFVVGNNNNQLSIFDLNGKELTKFTGHNGYILDVAYSPNGRFILSSSIDKSAKLWEVNTGKVIKNFEGHLESVGKVAFSPNGQYILTGSLDSTSILWDVQSGKKLHHFKAHHLEISAVAFSPDNRYVVTGSADKTAIIWDVQSGKLLRSLKGHTNMVRSIAFLPNGKLIITGSADKTIKLWNTQSGKQIRTIKGHKAGIRSVAISLDGQYILSASSDHSVRLWQIRNGRTLCTLAGHSSAVNEVAFSPTNNQIAVSVSNDKTIRKWEIELE